MSLVTSTRLRVDPIDVAAVDLGRRRLALVVAVDAVGWVGEPDGIVRFHDGVVRRVETLALPLVCEDFYRAVELGARHAARQMLAGDEPALVVDRVAVRIVGAVSENGHVARFLDEAHHAVVGNVRPDEITAGREPRRAFRPDRAGPVTRHAHVAGEELPKSACPARQGPCPRLARETLFSPRCAALVRLRLAPPAHEGKSGAAAPLSRKSDGRRDEVSAPK